MVKIRLRRMGTKQTPHYRVVVADSRDARNGRFLESLGTYDPLKQPVLVKIDEESALRWLSKGAQPTDTVRSLLRKLGVMRRFAESKKAAPTAA
jgi:small subunit ribosomal protein S16